MKISKCSKQQQRTLAAIYAVILGVSVGSQASAQTVLISPTVNDGGFESIASKVDFTSPTSGASSIPYWGATLFNSAGAAVGAPSDSGAENSIGSNTIHTGVAGAFWQPVGSSTSFNLETSHIAVTGDLFTLTWWAYTTGTGGQEVASLYSQAPGTIGATYAYSPSATLVAIDGAVNPTYALNNAYTEYTLNYTATAADAGNYIGLTFGNDGGSYIAADDFTLTVSPAPEPSVLTLAAVGGLSLLNLMRRRNKLSTQF
jgi:hypothetical protein